MDPTQFDSLTRRFATPRHSRRALLTTAAGLLAGATGRAAGAQVTQVSCGNQACASNPGSCNPGCVCCVYTSPITGQVTNSRCRPAGQCGTIATVACPPGQIVGPSGVCSAPTTTTTTTTLPPCPPYTTRISGECVNPCASGTCAECSWICGVNPDGSAFCVNESWEYTGCQFSCSTVERFYDVAGIGTRDFCSPRLGLCITQVGDKVSCLQ